MKGGDQNDGGHYRTMTNLMTIHLLEVYNGINEKYFRNRGHASPSSHVLACDDKDFNLVVSISEMIDGRFKTMEFLGKGSFGQVYKCYDVGRKREVAVKIIKSKSLFYKQGLVEVEMMSFLASKIASCNSSSSSSETNNSSYALRNNMFIIKYYENFMYKNHLCIVTELLCMDLYKTVQSTKGFTLNLVRKCAYQILTTLSFLRRDDVGIVHADLKPENIMRQSREQAILRVGDFGSSFKYSKERNFNHYIQSRYYRAPEIILGLPYDYSIDMWSLGCILVELHTGKPIFKGINEIHQLITIAELLGIPPDSMIENSPKKYKYFTRREPQEDVESPEINDEIVSMGGCTEEYISPPHPPPGKENPKKISPDVVRTTTAATVATTTIGENCAVAVTNNTNDANGEDHTTNNNNPSSCTGISADINSNITNNNNIGVTTGNTVNSAGTVTNNTRNPFIPLPQKRVEDKEDIYGLCRGIRTNWVFKSSLFRNVKAPTPKPRTIEGILSDPTIARRASEEEYRLFIDFLSKIFVYDPSLRILPQDALKHPFLG